MVNLDGMYKFAADFLKNRTVDYFVLGHRHRMANEKMGGNTSFILLGDWINSFSYGVFNGENFELKKYKK